MKKICPICKKEYYSKPSIHKYCSKECAIIAVKKDKISICEYCGKEYVYERKTQKYCSIECRQKASRKLKNMNICKTCGKEFIPKYPEQMYCCHKCHGVTRKNGCSNPETKRLYAVWQNIKRRCYNPHNLEYKNYGGRGISVCDEWKYDFKPFCQWAMANGYDKVAKRGECTIDRIDVNGNYCPENCRWVNNDIQANNKRTNIKYTYKGKTLTLAQWCKIYKKEYETIRDRIYCQGMSFEEAIEKPLKLKYIYLIHDGKAMSITDWAKEKNISKDIISRRLAKGWDISDVLDTPKNFDRLYVTYFGITKTIKEIAKDMRTTPFEVYKVFRDNDFKPIGHT